MRMAWYKLTGGEDIPSARERLAAYLLQQYHDQVLHRVAQEIDLNVVREQSTNLYVHFLGEQLVESAQHESVPRGEFAVGRLLPHRS